MWPEKISLPLKLQACVVLKWSYFVEQNFLQAMFTRAHPQVIPRCVWDMNERIFLTPFLLFLFFPSTFQYSSPFEFHLKKFSSALLYIDKTSHTCANPWYKYMRESYQESFLDEVLSVYREEEEWRNQRIRELWQTVLCNALLQNSEIKTRSEQFLKKYFLRFS